MEKKPPSYTKLVWRRGWSDAGAYIRSHRLANFGGIVAGVVGAIISALLNHTQDLLFVVFVSALGGLVGVFVWYLFLLCMHTIQAPPKLHREQQETVAQLKRHYEPESLECNLEISDFANLERGIVGIKLHNPNAQTVTRVDVRLDENEGIKRDETRELLGTTADNLEFTQKSGFRDNSIDPGRTGIVYIGKIENARYTFFLPRPIEDAIVLQKPYVQTGTFKMKLWIGGCIGDRVFEPTSRKAIVMFTHGKRASAQIHLEQWNGLAETDPV